MAIGYWLSGTVVMGDWSLQIRGDWLLITRNNGDECLVIVNCGDWLLITKDNGDA